MKMSNGLMSVELENVCSAMCMAVVLTGALIAPGEAIAGFGGADTKVKSFFDNVQGLLTIASISVVTIAVIFAGYQIAFAHKRMADVAPVLIGGFLIGAAAQLASMLIGSEGAEEFSAIVHLLPQLYA